MLLYPVSVLLEAALSDTDYFLFSYTSDQEATTHDFQFLIIKSKIVIGVLTYPDAG